MSAETLRRAAALMRERAEAATAPMHPWAVDIEEEDGMVAVRARRGAGPTVVTTVPLGYHERRANAEYIASWHPAVALAVADWLDSAADDWEGLKSAPGRADCPCNEHRALAVARAYLGSDE